jgi:hypothetical protein
VDLPPLPVRRGEGWGEGFMESSFSFAHAL